MDGTSYQAARAGLVRQLSGEIGDRRVLEAISRVPRELFLPFKERRHAYDDTPLPIGHGQTISQPLIIAMMTGSAGALQDYPAARRHHGTHLGGCRFVNLIGK